MISINRNSHPYKMQKAVSMATSRYLIFPSNTKVVYRKIKSGVITILMSPFPIILHNVNNTTVMQNTYFVHRLPSLGLELF